MNRKTRSFLFLFLVLIFLIAAPSAVFYSQGYRLDLENLRVVQTGGFYFKVVPQNVSIVITPENRRKIIKSDTDFFFGTSYIRNLLPGKYNLTVAKEGYHSWYKSLKIKEKMVTEMKNITLIPKDLDFTIIKKDVSNIFPLSHRREIVIKELVNDEEWQLTLYDPVRSSSKQLISSKKVSGNPLSVFSSPRRDEFLIDMGSHYLVIDSANETHYIINDITDPLLHPRKANSLIYLEDGNLSLYNYLDNTRSILAEEVETFGIREDGDIVWLSHNGLLFKNGDHIRNRSFLMNKESEYRILLPNLSEIAIIRDNTFYFLNNGDFKEIFQSYQKPVPSPDRRKLALYSNHEINVLYLDDTTEQPNKKRWENSFLTRFSGRVDNVEWLNNHHLIFNVEDEIKIIEIDDRDHINIIDVASLPDPKPYFDRATNQLYVLSDGNLFVSRVLF